MSPQRLVFAGTPEFAIPCLRSLIETGYEIAAVYTQPDRPAGRGRRIQQSPIKSLALAQGIPVCQPPSLKGDPKARALLRGWAPDLMVVVAYGLILPISVLETPRFGCVNVHASLLPRWRGAAPIQRAVLTGDSMSGVSIMRMEAGLDTGPVYLRRALTLGPQETGGSLHDRLAVLGAEALIETLPGVFDGSRLPEPQDDRAATYAQKLDKAEARIDWHRPAQAIELLVRAFDPWPVAQTSLKGETLRIWSARAIDLDLGGADPGSVLGTDRGGIAVATGAGALVITRLQAPGKRPMDAADYLNARHLDGARFV